jgi:small subunit ribosomal protein S16
LVKIRLRRVGAKKKPSYRLVVADSRAPRDGAFIDVIGHYNPLTDPATIVIDGEKAQSWLSQGAQPTATASRLLLKAGIAKEPKPAKARVTKKAKPAAAKKAEPAKAAAVKKPKAAKARPAKAAAAKKAKATKAGVTRKPKSAKAGVTNKSKSPKEKP